MELAEILTMLNEFWQEGRDKFMFSASMLLAGDSNKQRRREIIKQITGQYRPLSKCTYGAVVSQLDSHFSQQTLF